MALIKSVSGIRGTLGGKSGETLSPLDVVKFTTAYASRMAELSDSRRIVVGRDARTSGPMVSSLVCNTLIACGFDVSDLGLATTPTVEMAVTELKAAGGIVITASHNPGNWNALKLLNRDGEFLSAEEGKAVVERAENESFTYVAPAEIGEIETIDFTARHIELILALPAVNREAIAAADFKVVIDAVNSVGGIAVPMLLEALGVKTIEKMFCEPNGHFPHNPEPLPENLNQICSKLAGGKFDLGIVVDPDVDRLALICEDGSCFGEEYTLVAVADYILGKKAGNTVSNLSSSRALRDVTEKAGGTYFASAVGEVNVVTQMKECQAVIGGEGNGGVIYPELHYGRDALVGIALFLSHLAETGKSVSRLRASYPDYHISKNKIELTPEMDTDAVIAAIAERYKNKPSLTIDGLKIEFDKEWVHLRKSNTEPIIRIYAESESASTADNLAGKIISDIKEIINS